MPQKLWRQSFIPTRSLTTYELQLIMQLETSMLPTCSDCQHLLRVYVTTGDPPLYWCNNPATKEFHPPIGRVRRDAPYCNLFAPVELVREDSLAGTSARASAGHKPREKKSLETRMVVGFCLLMTVSALIPTLVHDGERAVIALSDFVQTCKGAVEIALGRQSPAKAFGTQRDNSSEDVRSIPPARKHDATAVPE